MLPNAQPLRSTSGLSHADAQFSVRLWKGYEVSRNRQLWTGSMRTRAMKTLPVAIRLTATPESSTYSGSNGKAMFLPTKCSEFETNGPGCSDFVTEASGDT